MFNFDTFVLECLYKNLKSCRMAFPKKQINICLLSLRKTLFIRLLCRKFQKSNLLKPSKRSQILVCYHFAKHCLSGCYAENSKSQSC